jgi:hypothetical protein
MFIYAPADNIVTEFSGDIDNTSFTSEQAILTATVKIDNTEAIQIPRRIYSRLKCPFNYKGSQCRFVSQMTLHANIDDAVLSIEVDSPFAYFDEMISGETHIIMIDNEEFEVTAVAVNPITYSQEMQRYRVRQGYPPAASTLQFTVTRAYGGTTAAAHTAGAVVDIVLCRKTEHDCRLHWNMLYFGAFPAIPKNKTTYS